jgi:hypothetical protein
MKLAKLIDFRSESKHGLSKVAIASSFIAVSSLIILPVQATYAAQIFFGEDINTTGTTNPNPERIPHPNADAARDAFFSNLQDIKTETFESFTPNSFISTINFGTDTASLSPSLGVANIPTGTLNGGFPISGNQTVGSLSTTDTVFSINFSSPQEAFGFYVTDVEIPSNLSLRFLLSDGSTIDRTVPTQAGTGAANNTGSVAYYGLIDNDNPFTAVSFIRNIDNVDVFAFDDFTIGSASQINVPEPSSILGLLSLGVLGIGVALKRRF